MGEIYEESLTLTNWRNAQDRPVSFGDYNVAKENLISDEKIGEGEPDEKESEGYTGNAGCTIEYWYRRAAVVWWARENHERVLCDYNLSGACRQLFALAGKRDKASQDAFQRLAAAVVEQFPEALPHERSLDRNLDLRKEDRKLLARLTGAGQGNSAAR